PTREAVVPDKTKDNKWRFEKPPFGEADSEGEASPPGAAEPKPITGVQGLLQAVADLRVEANDDFGATDVSDKELADKGLEKGKESLRIEVKRQPSFGSSDEKKEPVQTALLVGKK